MTAYPYLPAPPPARRRSTALVLRCSAILLGCACLLGLAGYAMLAGPFHMHLRVPAGLPRPSNPTPTPSATATLPGTATVRAASPRPPTPTVRAASPRLPTPTFTPTAISTPTPTVTRTNSPTPTSTATAPALSRLTICMASEPTTLFVYSAASYENQAVLDALLDGPVDYRTYAYVPVILEELPTLENGGAIVQSVTVHTNDRYVDANGNLAYWARTETKMDQIVVTFQLKDGLLWSDGAPLAADDSRFGYEIARDSATSASEYAYLAERTASYTALDSRTIRWVGLPGYTDTNYSARFFPPVSRQAYGALTPEQMINDQQVNTAPLGWGPFRIVEWALGDHIILERNPFYFRAGEGLPYLDEVVFRFMSKDLILAAVTNGDCDVGAQDNNWEAQLGALKAAQIMGSLVIKVVQSGYFEHLDFNLQPVDPRTPYFNKAGVRQAVAYCLDRQAIIDDVLGGLSAPPDSFLPPDHPFYNPQVTRYEFDPQKGLALLKQAGWEDHNGDGLLDQDGSNFTPVLYTRENLMRDRIAPLIAGQLRANCGMDVTVEYHAHADLFSTFPDGLVSGRRFDLAEFYWTTSLGWQTCDLFTSAQIPSMEAPAGTNYTGYANPAYDAACQAGRSPLPLAQRRKAYQQAQALFSDDIPSLPLYWRPKISVARPEVTGLQLDPTTATEFWNIEQVRLNP